MRFFFAKTGKFAIIFSKKYGGVAEWTIAPVFPALKIWKRGRAVYGVGLENQLGRNPLGGSNPPASDFIYLSGKHAYFGVYCFPWKTISLISKKSRK